MNAGVVERSIGCPSCGESITVLIDLSAGGQSTIEDCQVCCRPLQITFSTEGPTLVDLRVDRAG